MFSFIAGILGGAVATIVTLCLVNAGAPTENDMDLANARIQTLRNEAKEWETACMRLHDELRSATRMAQYWRARCMNEHCTFQAACDGNGQYPTNDDEPTHEEKLVSDIMDAVAVADKKDEAIPA